MSDSKKTQDALIPDEITPDMLVSLLPSAQGILKASAGLLSKLNGMKDSKNKDEYLAKWHEEMPAITETIYDASEIAQKCLDAGLAIETMLSKPLKSRELVMLNDLRRAFSEADEENVDPRTGEIK